MFAKLVDHEISKVLLGIIGVPATLAVLAGFIFGGGLLLVYFGDFAGFAIGLTSLFSVLGVCGAWVRVLNKSQSLSVRKRNLVVAMLVCGIISTVVSAIYTYKEAFPLITPTTLVLASIVGVVLILSTIEAE